MSYTPRRASKRWLDGDCPSHVLDILDNPKYGDRYTIIYGKECAFHLGPSGAIRGGCGEYSNTYLQYLGCNEAPTHPQGIGMHGEMTAWDAANYRRVNKHKKIKWTDLPEAVRKFVINSNKEEG